MKPLELSPLTLIILLILQCDPITLNLIAWVFIGMAWGVVCVITIGKVVDRDKTDFSCEEETGE